MATIKPRLFRMYTGNDIKFPNADLTRSDFCKQTVTGWVWYGHAGQI